jgi:hypothetical protein
MLANPCWYSSVDMIPLVPAPACCGLIQVIGNFLLHANRILRRATPTASGAASPTTKVEKRAIRFSIFPKMDLGEWFSKRMKRNSNQVGNSGKAPIAPADVKRTIIRSRSPHCAETPNGLPSTGGRGGGVRPNVLRPDESDMRRWLQRLMVHPLTSFRLSAAKRKNRPARLCAVHNSGRFRYWLPTGPAPPQEAIDQVKACGSSPPRPKSIDCN